MPWTLLVAPEFVDNSILIDRYNAFPLYLLHQSRWRGRRTEAINSLRVPRRIHAPPICEIGHPITQDGLLWDESQQESDTMRSVYRVAGVCILSAAIVMPAAI